MLATRILFLLSILVLIAGCDNSDPLPDPGPALQPPSPVVLSGEVRSSLGYPVASAIITLSPDEGEPEVTLTDSVGDFTITVPEGMYTLTAEKQGYEEHLAALTLDRDETNLSLFLRGRADLQGVLIDPRDLFTSYPAPNTPLRFIIDGYEVSSRTDAAGHFTLAEVPLGEWIGYTDGPDVFRGTFPVVVDSVDADLGGVVP